VDLQVSEPANNLLDRNTFCGHLSHLGDRFVTELCVRHLPAAADDDRETDSAAMASFERASVGHKTS